MKLNLNLAALRLFLIAASVGFGFLHQAASEEISTPEAQKSSGVEGAQEGWKGHHFSPEEKAKFIVARMELKKEFHQLAKKVRVALRKQAEERGEAFKSLSAADKKVKMQALRQKMGNPEQREAFRAEQKARREKFVAMSAADQLKYLAQDKSEVPLFPMMGRHHRHHESRRQEG